MTADKLLALSLRGVRRSLDQVYDDLRNVGREDVAFIVSDAIDAVDKAARKPASDDQEAKP